MVTIMISEHIQVQGMLLSQEGDVARVTVGKAEVSGRLLPSLRRPGAPVRLVESA